MSRARDERNTEPPAVHEQRDRVRDLDSALKFLESSTLKDFLHFPNTKSPAPQLSGNKLVTQVALLLPTTSLPGKNLLGGSLFQPPKATDTHL